MRSTSSISTSDHPVGVYFFIAAWILVAIYALLNFIIPSQRTAMNSETGRKKNYRDFAVLFPLAAVAMAFGYLLKPDKNVILFSVCIGCYALFRIIRPVTP